MALFNAAEILAPDPMKKQLDDYLGQLKEQLQRMVLLQQRGGQIIYGNNQRTPEEMVLLLGSDAGDLFRASEAFSVFLKSALQLPATPPVMPPEFESYTINADGTVTLIRRAA